MTSKHQIFGSGSITTVGDAAGRAAGALTRSKTDFRLHARPGFLLIDIDNPPAGTTIHSAWATLVDVMPALGQAGCVAYPSGSSHIFNGNEDLTGLRGVHFYVMLHDASDAPRTARALEVALWNAGHGRVEVSRAGVLLTRCLVDLAVFDQARVVLAGGALCEAPLEQRRGTPIVINDGGFLDTVELIADPTPAEIARFEALVQEAKAAAQPEAQRRKAEHRDEQIRVRVPKLIAEGVPAAEAERRVTEAIEASYMGVLLSDFVLTVVNDGGAQQEATVGQVLSARDRWDRCKCLDPLNPEHRGGAPDAVLYLQGTSPIVYSLDDGGKRYRLRRVRRAVEVRLGCRADLVSALIGIVAGLDNVFATPAGPAVVENGRRLVLGVESLINLIGTEVALVKKTAKGDTVPADLPFEVARLVLGGLCDASASVAVGEAA